MTEADQQPPPPVRKVQSVSAAAATASSLPADGSAPQPGGEGDAPSEDTGALPRREILTKEDLDKYHASQAYAEFVGFIEQLAESVVGKPLSAECHTSDNVRRILKIIDDVQRIADDTPPQTDHKSRFGNPAFRLFYDKVTEAAPGLHTGLVPEEKVHEVSRYFIDSFGNRRRIDYGTGHEANFIAWLLCLRKLGLFSDEDSVAVVLRVFYAYLGLMRKLQFAYWLEPAGSHGVWGLDDYHFLPFLFGAAQLQGHKYIRPKSIHDTDVVEQYSKDYLYLACIHFINTVKTSASLRWHSPMLDDISGVRTWDKVHSGMVKMYKAEVLGKLPIMQHFMFGSLICFKGSGGNVELGMATEPGEQDAGGHIHVYAMGQEFPQCCGMKVPSAIGAMMADKEHGPKRLPFD